MRKVLQLHFSGTWEGNGCLQHVTRAWVNHSENYQHYFASSAGAGYKGRFCERPHSGFSEHRLANRIYNKILRRGRFCYYNLIPIIEDLHPDILHFHNRHDLIDQIVARLSYKPHVVCHYHCLYNKLFVPASANLLIGVSKWVTSWIDRKENPVAALATLHNPYSPLPPIVHIHGSAPLFVTYSSHYKGIKHLCEAVNILNSEGLTFQVHGFGFVYPDIRLPHNLQLTHTLPRPDFLNVLGRSSAFLCTNYNTAFSVAVMEAIAQEKPVICPWDIGAVDLLPSDSIILYESHNFNSMADAMRRFLYMSGPERAALASRALDSASVYAEEKIGAKLEQLYDKFC